jgi:hypothetical protein
MNPRTKIKLESLLNNKTPSVTKIAKKHGVTVDKINEQLDQGEQVEKEHTTDKKLARKIARDHLDEVPDYYTKLKKVEGDK